MTADRIDVVTEATTMLFTEIAIGSSNGASSGTSIEHADALDWLARQEPGQARAIVFDPPYSRHSPMRGREDGAAGSVSAPFPSCTGS